MSDVDRNVRAITRVATPDEQQKWIEVARSATAGQPPAEDDATPPGASASMPASLADALLEMARLALQQQPPAAGRRTRAALTAHVDPLTGWGRLRDGELLPPSSLRSVRRTLPGRAGLSRLRPLPAEDLRLHDRGRRSRRPSLALRELLGTLDGECCRFPGCIRRRMVDAHHVRFWSDGGPTDLANLVNPQYELITRVALALQQCARQRGLPPGTRRRRPL